MSRETTEDYLPPASEWVRRQLDEIDAAGGDTRAVSIQDRPVVVVVMRGRRTGGLRRVPLMRVEHEGAYAAVASKGGAPEHPEWHHNLLADPEVVLHDGTAQVPMRARVVEGAERAAWWERSVAAFPPYADYQRSTDRQIPVFVLEATR
ncbi:nitroreductase/quinone reductase family protein [Ornithinimicrobium sediminis]|uniref:nitroreductase/quinone reductase family protein n=1 Tax=Ornithinimicrobium sediminis TaxID=2904603 RepID=UPI001E2CBC1E|nr:nitroreductase/quinone reductase family protein [Ornithinimicrobium sediminis]MCE0487781.1 nitroreductase family deazaflavin-dependent oxidoreductase [Ornithinimicrobium sediminis]